MCLAPTEANQSAAPVNLISALFCFAVDQVKFGPPRRKVTEPYPDMVTQLFLWERSVASTCKTQTWPWVLLSAGVLWRRLESVRRRRHLPVRASSPLKAAYLFVFLVLLWNVTYFCRWDVSSKQDYSVQECPRIQRLPQCLCTRF